LDKDLKAFCEKGTVPSSKEAKTVLHELNAQGYKILASQHHVCDKSLQLFTHIDLLLEHKDGKRVVAEVKTGCLYRRCSTPQGKFLYQPDSSLGDCPLHQHQMQALLGRHLYLCTHPEFKDSCGVLLLYVDDHGSELLHDFNVVLTQEGLDAIRSRAARKKRTYYKKTPWVSSVRAKKKRVKLNSSNSKPK
jgi:hypothetical protein